jgi:hypothetical protein
MPYKKILLTKKYKGDKLHSINLFSIRININGWETTNFNLVLTFMKGEDNEVNTNIFESAFR